MCTLSFWYNVVVHLIDYSIVCFPSSSTVKNLPAMQETSVQFLGWEDARKKETATTPVFLFTEFHGQRSLEGFSPRGHQELDMTEWLTLSLSHSVDKVMWYSHKIHVIFTLLWWSGTKSTRLPRYTCIQAETHTRKEETEKVEYPRYLGQYGANIHLNEMPKKRRKRDQFTRNI